jgi:acetyltransferase-like isoleucine patch superfamily enzyme
VRDVATGPSSTPSAPGPSSIAVARTGGRSFRCFGRPPTTADVALAAWEWFGRRATIGAGSRRASRFGAFGAGSRICFPPAALFGEHAIRIGAGTLVGPGVALTAGMGPGQDLIGDAIVGIGDRCVIGRGSSIVGHYSITIGDDVYTGPSVYITDQNHDWERLDQPIGRQAQPELPVRIGAGSWLGTGVVVLPGVTVGDHAVIGAGTVLSRDVPARSVVVGNPARVVQRWVEGSGWLSAGDRG